MTTGRQGPADAGRASLARVILLGFAELCLTVGALALLFVAYQLWWTNVVAHQQVKAATQRLDERFSAPAATPPPARFDPGEGFAIMYIPRLGEGWSDVVTQGVDKATVLDKGLVGHYDGSTPHSPRSVMPGEVGNFAVAAHSVSHGQPFAHLDRLRPGDRVYVRTARLWHVYRIEAGPYLTDPSDIGVVAATPEHSGFAGTGRYLTMTTCWPPLTSARRMIYWGRLVSQQPQGPGLPPPAGLTLPGSA